MKLEFGDVVWVELGAPSSGSHEQAGTRPAAVVIQEKNIIDKLPVVLIVPFTKVPGALRFETAFQVDSSATNGLSVSSVLLPFQLRALDKKRILNKIGKLEPVHLEKLRLELSRLIPVPVQSTTV